MNRWLIIVVTYNSQEVIGDCLSSLLIAAGEYERIKRASGLCQICVVDNCSYDSTVPIVKTFREVTLIVSNENGGFARAVNMGLRQSDAPFVFLLNPDCLVDRRCLIALTNVFEQQPQAGVLGLHLRNPDGTFQPSGGPFPSLVDFLLSLFLPRSITIARRFRARQFDPIEPVDEVSGAAMAVRRSAFQATEMMDESFFLYFEDLDLCMRAKRAGYRVFWVRDALAFHHWSLSIKKVLWVSRPAFMHSALTYFRKHYGTAAATLMRLSLLFRYVTRCVIGKPQPLEVWLSWRVLSSRELDFRKLVNQICRPAGS